MLGYKKKMNYKIYKSTDTDDYITVIYSDSFKYILEIRKEIESKGFTITTNDWDYEDSVIIFNLKKNNMFGE